MNFNEQRRQLAALFQAETIDETAVLRHFYAMFRQAAREDARAEFDGLVAELADVDAALYEKHEPTLLYWRLINAVADGRADALKYALLKLAGAAARDVATFLRAADALAYHGRTDALAEMLGAAWPLLSRAEGLADAHRRELASLLTDTLIFQHLAQAETADLSPLLDGLNQYFPIDEARLAPYVRLLSRQAGYRRQLRDFDFGSSEQAAQNLSALLIEAVAYLHHVEGAPFTKANLLRLPLLRYFTERRTGQLEPRPDMAAVLRGERPMPRPPEQRHPLCPDGDTLARLFEKLLHAAQPQPYRTAVCFELLPGWLRFLLSRGLIDGDQQHQTLQEVGALRDDLQQTWRAYVEDPALAANVGW